MLIKHFSSKTGSKTKVPTFTSHKYWTADLYHCNNTRKVNKIHKNRKEEVKLYPFIDYIVVFVNNPKTL